MVEIWKTIKKNKGKIAAGAAAIAGFTLIGVLGSSVWNAVQGNKNGIATQPEGTQTPVLVLATSAGILEVSSEGITATATDQPSFSLQTEVIALTGDCWTLKGADGERLFIRNGGQTPVQGSICLGVDNKGGTWWLTRAGNKVVTYDNSPTATP